MLTAMENCGSLFVCFLFKKEQKSASSVLLSPDSDRMPDSGATGDHVAGTLHHHLSPVRPSKS